MRTQAEVEERLRRLIMRRDRYQFEAESRTGDEQAHYYDLMQRTQAQVDTLRWVLGRQDSLFEWP